MVERNSSDLACCSRAVLRANRKEASASPDIEVHFAFRVPSIPDFTTHLDQMQVKYRSFDGSGKVTNRPDGVHQIYFQDPDGYWIEVNDNKF